jgi:hypothetical protein
MYHNGVEVEESPDDLSMNNDPLNYLLGALGEQANNRELQMLIQGVFPQGIEGDFVRGDMEVRLGPGQGFLDAILGGFGNEDEFWDEDDWSDEDDDDWSDGDSSDDDYDLFFL